MRQNVPYTEARPTAEIVEEERKERAHGAVIVASAAMLTTKARPRSYYQSYSNDLNEW